MQRCRYKGVHGYGPLNDIILNCSGAVVNWHGWCGCRISYLWWYLSIWYLIVLDVFCIFQHYRSSRTPKRTPRLLCISVVSGRTQCFCLCTIFSVSSYLQCVSLNFLRHCRAYIVAIDISWCFISQYRTIFTYQAALVKRRCISQWLPLVSYWRPSLLGRVGGSQ